MCFINLFKMDKFKSIPGVDKILAHPKIKSLIEEFNIEIVTFSIRKIIDSYRDDLKNNGKILSFDSIIQSVINQCRDLFYGNIKAVINATGVIIHTNLGRSPFGEKLLSDTFNVLKGYCNLEFNLKTGKRSNRNFHLREILRFITGAEDVMVVNNNAAAVVLILNSMALNKEVIISRSELIEIGGSFRIPDIMKSSGCNMHEIGSTNKTHFKDFENAINENTALIFKAHKSNYIIKGFTEDVSLKDLVALGKKNNIPVVYDMGCGLLKKYDIEGLKSEPDVKQALAQGIDLICFSGDKLLGGPQAGIIAGKKQFIEKLRNMPLMRALRVDKTTLALLENACRYYISEQSVKENNCIIRMLCTDINELKAKAEKLSALLKKYNIASEIVKSKARCGGGTLPDETIDSYSVLLKNNFKTKAQASAFAEKIYIDLLNTNKPILAILKQGELFFDVLTIFDDQFETVASMINDVYKKNN